MPAISCWRKANGPQRSSAPGQAANGANAQVTPYAVMRSQAWPMIVQKLYSSLNYFP
jgi:hypothetical protein